MEATDGDSLRESRLLLLLLLLLEEEEEEEGAALTNFQLLCN